MQWFRDAKFDLFIHWGLAEACARHGIRFGFYYSQAQDRHEPNAAGNTWDFGPDPNKKDSRGKPVFNARTDWRCTTRPGKRYFTILKMPREVNFLLYRLLTGITEAINACFWLRRDLL